MPLANEYMMPGQYVVAMTPLQVPAQHSMPAMEFSLHAGPNTLGRKKEFDNQLDELLDIEIDRKFVSKTHATIDVAPSGMSATVTDWESTTNT